VFDRYGLVDLVQTPVLPLGYFSSVPIGIATGWTLGVRFPVGVGDFSCLHSIQTVVGPTQPSIQWIQGFLGARGKAAGA
jgi:hypothetical protein